MDLRNNNNKKENFNINKVIKDILYCILLFVMHILNILYIYEKKKYIF